MDYDVLVIGTGAAGSTAAAACAKAGLRTAVADRLPYGGTCARRGCDPKKVLLAAAEAKDRSDALAGEGLTGDLRIDWPALIARKRTFTDPVPAEREAWLSGVGVDLLHGDVTIAGASGDEVTAALDGEPLSAGTVVVATGALPRSLGIPGEDLLTTSDAFMETDYLPASMVFIGGGYVSFEFAHIAHAAGAHVTIVHRSSRVLKGFDSDLCEALVERYRDMGIDVVTDAPATEVRRHGERLVVATPKGEFEAEMAVHGAGRVPDVSRLGLETAGVEYDGRGVRVDERLRSVSNPRFYAAGDAAALGMPLTPVASRQGGIVAANILGDDMAFDGRATASVVFSDPPLATVGVSADEADPDVYEVRHTDMSGWFTQRRLGATHAAAKLVFEKETGRLAGAHILGPEAAEVINVFALAVRSGLRREDLAEVVWAYPTAGSDIPYML